MKWYGLFLGSGANCVAERLRIQLAFLPAFAAAGEPDEMAIFSHAGFTDASAHEVTFYFSPAASAFAKTLSGAAPCEKPSREDLGLELGNRPGAWHALFPE
jgi:hypothetical protein